jgi:hypothetical protein
MRDMNLPEASSRDSEERLGGERLIEARERKVDLRTQVATSVGCPLALVSAGTAPPHLQEPLPPHLVLFPFCGPKRRMSRALSRVSPSAANATDRPRS